MSPQLLERIRRIWLHPVWASVIASAIFTSFLYLVSLFWRGVVHHRWVWWICLAAMLSCVLLVAHWLYSAYGTRIHTELSLRIEDRFSHSPIVSISLKNLSRRAVRISSVKFETKNHWDMPDPRDRGYTRPLIPSLPPDLPFIKVYPETGSVAEKHLGLILAGGHSERIRFRLVTDHSPGYGLGLFPVHLGVAIFLQNGRKLQLPDIMVSLHGQIVFGGGPQPWDPSLERRPGDIQHYANAVLSEIEKGALSEPTLERVLRQIVKH